MTNQENNTNETIITADIFNANSITITEPKKSKKGGKTSIKSYLLHDVDGDDVTMFVETPCALQTPFGVNCYQKGDSGSSDYSINVSARVQNKEEQKAVDAWFDQWKAIDEKMIDFGIEHSKDIFGKKYTEKQRAVVEALYSRCVKQDDAGEYPARLAPKIQRVRVKEGDGKDAKWNPTDKPDVMVFKQVGGDIEEIEYENFDPLVSDCPAGSSVQLIIQPRIWFISGKFGLSLNVVQMQIIPSKAVKKPKKYAFSKGPAAPKSNDGGDEDDTEESASADESGEEVEDSEEEEEQE